MADTLTPGEIAENDRKIALMQERINGLVEGMRQHKARGCPHITCPGNDVVEFLRKESDAASAWLLIALTMLHDRDVENPLAQLEREFHGQR